MEQELIVEDIEVTDSIPEPETPEQAALRKERLEQQEREEIVRSYREHPHDGTPPPCNDSLNKKNTSRTAKWTVMLKNWQLFTKKKSGKIKERVRKGIPPQIRGAAWKALLVDRYPPEQREIVSYRGLVARGADASDPQSQYYIKQIDLDINRTMRERAYFETRFQHGQVSLFNVLVAYAAFDPVVGYCQGMASITALLLLHLPEEEAFWALVNLLSPGTVYNMQGMFVSGFPKLMECFFVHEKLMEKYLPRLHQHFQNENVQTSMYATKWYMTVFLGVLASPTIIRIWDLLISEGYKVIYSTAINLLRMLENELLSSSFERIMTLLSTLSTMDIDTDKLITLAVKRKVKNKVIEKHQQEFMAMTNTSAQRQRH